MIFGRRKQQQELDVELEHHIELLEAEHRSRGLSSDEARQAAQRDIGGTLRTRELYRDQQGFIWLDQLWRDLRHALRSLRRTPALTVAVIATLALGIGANTAIFSVVQTVLYRPLPFKDPNRLVWISNYIGLMETQTMSPLLRFTTTSVQMEQNGVDYVVHAASTSGSITELFGIKLFLGRDILPKDVPPDRTLPASSVALISYRLFQEQYSADPQILGQSVRMYSRLHTIVGVLPPDFRLPLPDGDGPQFEPDVIVPQSGFGNMIGRLRPGLGPQAARDELTALSPNKNLKPYVVPLHDFITGGARRELLVLSIAVACVLLIACVNVTNLLLARSLTRTQETSVRAALGAGRFAMLRTVLTETSLLSIGGGVAGLALAAAILSYVASLRGHELPRLPDVGLDLSTIAFAAGCCVITAILAAVGPMLSVLSPSLIPVLRRGGESHASQSRGLRWFHNGLASAQIALALLLVSAAGLLLKSLSLSRSPSAEADAQHVLISNITRDLTPRASAFNQPSEAVRRNEEILREIRLLPGVRSAAIFAGGYTGQYLHAQGDPPPARAALVSNPIVTEQFFPASGYRLLAGRLFKDREDPAQLASLVVNETFLKQFMDSRTPQQALNRIIVNTERGSTNPLGIVVGVVNDLHLIRSVKPVPYIFRAVSQSDDHLSGFLGGMVVRTTGEPMQLTSRVLKILEPHGLRLREPSTLEDLVNASVATRQFETNLLTGFAAVALTLAIIGIYGVLSYAVSQRTREIGIRVSLGASHSKVLNTVLRDGWKLTLAGIIAGLAGSLAFTQTMRSMLTNVEPTDPIVLASVCLLIFTIATLAALVPARRATRVDPLNALRYD